MPQSTHMNGYTNGHNANGFYEMEDQQNFLFTSESVGEGHPGKLHPKNSHWNQFECERWMCEPRGQNKTRRHLCGNFAPKWIDSLQVAQKFSLKYRTKITLKYWSHTFQADSAFLV